VHKNSILHNQQQHKNNKEKNTRITLTTALCLQCLLGVRNGSIPQLSLETFVNHWITKKNTGISDKIVVW